MFRANYRGVWLWACSAVCLVAGALLISWLALGLLGSAGATTRPGSASQAPRRAPVAPALASVVSAQGGRTLCAWPREAIGARRVGNVGFIDTQAVYLMGAFGYTPGVALRIQGLFPYARYMSFMLYGGGSNAVVDRLTDQSIAPDAGSTNPFRPLADRHARRRAYTIYLRQGAPPRSGRASNTLYTGSNRPVLVIYRVYAPDQSAGAKGADVYGGVPKPGIAVLGAASRHGAAVRSLPLCATPQPARGAPTIAIKTPLLWHRVGRRGGGGTNADEAYLQVRLDHTDGAYVLRFQAPIFADTPAGHPITGREDVRFWSICQYAMATTKVVACLHDDEAVANRAGEITLVVSTLAERPGWATRAHGVNWLPFGPERIGMLIYRQLLPRAGFRGSVAQVAPNVTQHELRTVLGRYLPAIQTCALAAYTHCLHATS